MPQQFENPANVEVHARTTAQEIAADFPSGIDALITGVGTGGHITGCAQVLKKMWPKLKVFAVEPTASPVITGGKPAPHPIQGIGAGFIPKNLRRRAARRHRSRSRPRTAREMARRCAREEGMLVGISSGATLAAIAQKLPELPPARRCSASTTTPASATCRSKASCRRTALAVLRVEAATVGERRTDAARAISDAPDPACRLSRSTKWLPRRSSSNSCVASIRSISLR